MELCPASHPLNIHRLVCPLGKRRSCARRVSWDNPSKDQLRLEPLWAPRQLQYPLAMNVQSCLEYQKTRVFQRPLWASKGGVIGDGVSEEGGLTGRSPTATGDTQGIPNCPQVGVWFPTPLIYRRVRSPVRGWNLCLGQNSLVLLQAVVALKEGKRTSSSATL